LKEEKKETMKYDPSPIKESMGKKICKGLKEGTRQRPRPRIVGRRESNCLPTRERKRRRK
jgi:hypothetical protein